MSKVVLITGASTGVGKATAEKFLSKGYTVYATSRAVEIGLMQDLKDKGAKTLAMDVTNDEQVTELVNDIIREQSRLDILVNNAGYGVLGMMECVSIEEAKKQFDVNVFGLVRAMKAVLPQMRKQQLGHIINLSSVAGKVASPMMGWYSSSKFAIEGLTDAIRAEVKDFGIKVVLIEPNGVKTKFEEGALKQLNAITHLDVYQSKVEGFKKAFSKQFVKAPYPETIANLIFKAAESKNPKVRYTVLSAKIAMISEAIMPTKFMDNMKLWVLGMK